MFTLISHEINSQNKKAEKFDNSSVITLDWSYRQKYWFHFLEQK